MRYRYDEVRCDMCNRSDRTQPDRILPGWVKIVVMGKTEQGSCTQAKELELCPSCARLKWSVAVK